MMGKKTPAGGTSANLLGLLATGWYVSKKGFSLSELKKEQGSLLYERLHSDKNRS